MEHYPLLSNWMRNLHCLFLDRKDIKQGLKTILQAADYVKSGISVCIFPEGTRNKNADETDMLPFHDGSFKIATRAKSPIIPIAISNSANIWEANFPKMSPTHVVIEYGKPIIPSELDRDTQRHQMCIRDRPCSDDPTPGSPGCKHHRKRSERCS